MSDKDLLAITVVLSVPTIIYFAYALSRPNPSPDVPEQDLKPDNVIQQKPDQPAESSGFLSPAQLVGALLMLLAFGGGILVMTMDTSRDSIHNIGLLNARLTYAICSGFLFLGSLLLILLGGKK